MSPSREDAQDDDPLSSMKGIESSPPPTLAPVAPLLVTMTGITVDICHEDAQSNYVSHKNKQITLDIFNSL